jgi:hypothetical protein
MTSTTHKRKGDMVNLSLFETSGVAPRPLQERANGMSLDSDGSRSAEAAVFRIPAADEGGHSGTVENKGRSAVEDPRESLGGKGGAASTPGKEFLSISELLKNRYLNLTPDPELREKKVFARSTHEELKEYFFLRLAPSWPGKKPLTRQWFGVKTCWLTAQDLFYLKSICQDSVNRGGIFSKTFWGAIKPIENA